MTQIFGSNGVILPYTEPSLEIGNLTCKNLLKNHNFNIGITDPVSFGWNTNLTGNYRDVQYDPPEKMPGYCAAYLLSLYSTDSQKGIWQTVNLTAGQPYVFSCYLKLAQGNSNPAHGVYLMVKSANGTTTYRRTCVCILYLLGVVCFAVGASKGEGSVVFRMQFFEMCCDW